MPRRRKRERVPGLFEIAEQLAEGNERLRQEQVQRRRHEQVLADRDYMALTPRQFEEFIADLFKRQGYTVEHVGGANDRGADLKMELGGNRYVVQCKQYRLDRAVGPATVREFETVVKRNRARGFLITTSSFTDAARKAAPRAMTLMDRQALDNLAWRLIEHRAPTSSPMPAVVLASPASPRSWGGLTRAQARALLTMLIVGCVLLACLACYVVSFTGPQ